MPLYPDTTPSTSEFNVSREMSIRGAYLKKMLKRADEDSILITFKEPHMREVDIYVDFVKGAFGGKMQIDNVTLKDLETGEEVEHTGGVGTFTIRPNKSIVEDIIDDLQDRYGYNDMRELLQAVQEGLKVNIMSLDPKEKAKLRRPSIRIPRIPERNRPIFIEDEVEMELLLDVWYPEFDGKRVQVQPGLPLRVNRVLGDIDFFWEVDFGD